VPTASTVLVLAIVLYQLSDIDIQQDHAWAAEIYCGSLLRHNGLNIVGTPIGAPDYASCRLHDFIPAFTHTTRQDQLVQSPTSRIRLYLTCIQQQ
jgi:hypothetical protein